MQPCPPLPPNLQRLLDAEYPRFSDAEMARRRAAVEAVLAEAGCEHLVFYGANRAGSSVQWLTQWPVTTEAIGVFSPGKPDALYVQYVNHAPLARKLADKAETVEWGGELSIRKVDRRTGAARRAREQGRGDRTAAVRAARGARRALRHDDEPEPRLCAAAPREVGGGARLVPHRGLALATAAWRACKRRSSRA